MQKRFQICWRGVAGPHDSDVDDIPEVAEYFTDSRQSLVFLRKVGGHESPCREHFGADRQDRGDATNFGFIFVQFEVFGTFLDGPGYLRGVTGQSFDTSKAAEEFDADKAILATGHLLHDEGVTRDVGIGQVVLYYIRDLLTSF